MKRPIRIFTVSDLHVDYDANMAWVNELSATEYANDVLVLAGDISDDIDKLEIVFSALLERFTHVFFVPGNHDLWVRAESGIDSRMKLDRVLQLCKAQGIKTEPFKLGSNGNAVWIVPLFSWYVKPEEGMESLFVSKQGRDLTMMMWSDNSFIKWPAAANGDTMATHLHALNEARLRTQFDAPVISFSHFLPRTDLIFPLKAEMDATLKSSHYRPSPFNFSRVAGSSTLETQIRRLGSAIHVYGHQHRNRVRRIDGVTYISHCLGYPQEREQGLKLEQNGPKLIWDARPIF